MNLPLDDIDRADEEHFNRILWRSVTGYDLPYPHLARRRIVGPEDWPSLSRPSNTPTGGLR